MVLLSKIFSAQYDSSVFVWIWYICVFVVLLVQVHYI